MKSLKYNLLPVILELNQKEQDKLDQDEIWLLVTIEIFIVFGVSDMLTKENM